MPGHTLRWPWGKECWRGIAFLGRFSKGRHAVDTLGFVTPGVLATVYGS